MAASEKDTKSNPNDKKNFVTIPVANLFTGKEFPGDAYLCINHRMIRYKGKGDSLSTQDLDKLIHGRVRYLFVDLEEHNLFVEWQTKANAEEEAKTTAIETEETKPIVDIVKEQRRIAMDIFDNPKDNNQVKAALNVSKKMVTEFLRKPYTVGNVASLQRYSKGCLDHSVNVSMLSVFLGLNMGYASQVILEHLALGGLYHDIGKTQLSGGEETVLDPEDPKLQEHPKLGKAMLETQKEVPNEVCMIVVQHHEMLDGTGYPARLRGLAVYDLARIVAIANIYDNLISEVYMGDMKEAATQALDRLEREYDGKLDPKKLEKSIKILRYSFL